MSQRERTYSEKIADFWSKVDKSGGDSACWNWTGRLTGYGYGAYEHLGMNGAHRTAYLLTKGDPGSLFVLHSCDNRACCNPAHLSAGTQLQNMREKMARGRHPAQPTSPFKQQRARTMLAELRYLAAQEDWAEWTEAHDWGWVLGFSYAECRWSGSGADAVQLVRITDAGRDFLELQSIADRRVGVG